MRGFAHGDLKYTHTHTHTHMHTPITDINLQKGAQTSE